jgi:hypothetical protein
MSWTFCTSGSAIIKAGANCNSTIIASGSAMAKWSDLAEGRIMAETRRDWKTNFANLDTGIQGIIQDICSSLIAMNIVAYDMGGYTDRREAETILDVNDDRSNKGLTILKDFKSNSIQSP